MPSDSQVRGDAPSDQVCAVLDVVCTGNTRIPSAGVDRVRNYWQRLRIGHVTVYAPTDSVQAVPVTCIACNVINFHDRRKIIKCIVTNHNEIKKSQVHSPQLKSNKSQRIIFNLVSFQEHWWLTTREAALYIISVLSVCVRQ